MSACMYSVAAPASRSHAGRASCSRAIPAAASRQQPQQQQQQHAHAFQAQSSRRAVLGGLIGAALLSSGAAHASGLEAVALPPLPPRPAALDALAASRQAKLDEAEASFQSSELLATLKARTAENGAKNRKAITDKYCQRQAELGVGDCGGLRLIPGMTKSGVQKRPEWLDKLVGTGGEEE